MNRRQLQNLAVLTGILVAVAIPILFLQGHLEKQKQTAEDESAQEKKAAEAQIASLKAHAEFVSQYVNTNFTRTPGVSLVAVAVASENKTMNQGLSAALISRFKGEHAQFVDNFFKPPVVSDGLFSDIFNGSTELFARLEITNSVDALLLGRQYVQYSTNRDLDNVITANMRLEVATLPVAGQLQSRAWTFIANGTGFRPAEARMQAEERIIEQMTNKADMTLGQIISNH